MTDAFVSFAVQKLGDFLIQQVSLRKNLRKEVDSLRNELLFMQSFIREAEQKQSGDQRVQQWVFEINSIANDAVAILESFSFEAGKGDDDRFVSRLKACACICRKEKKLYNVAEEIQSLKQRIMDISRKRETYGIINIDSTNAGEGPSNQVRTMRRTTSYVDEQDNIFVGLQDVVEKLLAQLLKAEPRRSVISIHGMGGLGKTTLARNLYNSPNIVSSFPTRAWICVSQEYNTMDLLKNIIKSIQGRTKGTLDFLERMTESDLEIYLRDLLKEGKYLVVVDDVWQREAWESLKRAFPDSKKGSRVIITTRKHDVAERADNRGFVHNLRFLSQKESWDLFCRKQLDVRAMVPEMVRIAKDMVEKCRGLPLAIVVLSGLLSHKRGLDQWQKVKDHFWQNIQDDSIQISYILSLSYNDLSATLKQCFLYFGVFPEDQEVDAEKIILLWMAEGLIPNGEERMEDVAEGFLNELIRRSLIQEVRSFWEKVTVCKVHDLLRDLAVQKAFDIKFFDIYDPKKHSISSLCIRHVIHGQGERYLSLDLSHLKLRSIMFFDPDFRNMHLTNFSSVFRHIYVLYLDIGGYVMTDVIGSLYYLKLLSLRGVCNIPSSISNLKNLKTLLVDDHGGFSRLPQKTVDLINLRHLVAPYSEPLKCINKLTSLQVLKGIRCDQWKDVDPVDLVNLRELSMHDITESYSLYNISSLKNLSTLRLLCYADESFPSLEFVNSCQKLQKLRLRGKIKKLPLFPSSITMMVLWKSKLREDPMPILGMLPNLRNLELEEAYEGKEITCSDNNFSQLEFLRLHRLEMLETWHLAPSAMPHIKGLDIKYCPHLYHIPKRMQDVGITPFYTCSVIVEMKRAFLDSKNGSRVIITTRKENVAERADNKGFVHRLRFLSQEESWDLFCRKLLDVRAMVPAMERLARDMVDKCGGLPLAIVILSGLLLHKRRLDEWQKVKNHLWKNIKDDSIEISYILSLSYSDLSTALEQCFLYFGIFPEDQELKAENTIWLWMAEGFIPRGEERMEDVAEGFLNELIRRSLVQVAGTFWEKVILCRVHDVVRDLSIQKALEVNFFDIYDPRNHSISFLCIRHAIDQGEKYLSLDLSNLKLRSVMFFDPDFVPPQVLKIDRYPLSSLLHLQPQEFTDTLCSK